MESMALPHTQLQESVQVLPFTFCVCMCVCPDVNGLFLVCKKCLEFAVFQIHHASAPEGIDTLMIPVH